MKKFIAMVSCFVLLMSLTGCGALQRDPKSDGPHAQMDYPAAIMVDGVIYLKSAAAMPAEVDVSAVIGYTIAYTDTFPEQNGETNFNRQLGMPYARVAEGIAVLYENEWYLCLPEE